MADCRGRSRPAAWSSVDTRSIVKTTTVDDGQIRWIESDESFVTLSKGIPAGSARRNHRQTQTTSNRFHVAARTSGPILVAYVVGVTAARAIAHYSRRF